MKNNNIISSTFCIITLSITVLYYFGYYFISPNKIILLILISVLITKFTKSFLLNLLPIIFSFIFLTFLFLNQKFEFITQIFFFFYFFNITKYFLYELIEYALYKDYTKNNFYEDK